MKKKKKIFKREKQKGKKFHQTNLSDDFIKLCKKKLIAKLNELQSFSVKNEINTMLEVGDEVDLAGHDIGKEIFHELSDAQKNLLELINSALEKIENSTYGICEKCGKTIPKKRLEVLPWVRYCIKCQTNVDKLSK